jgi:5-methylthioadenosine/S-adenosylhomocysteine deaminase
MAYSEPGLQLIRGARVADPKTRRAGPAGILISDGPISEVGPPELDGWPEGIEIAATGMPIHPRGFLRYEMTCLPHFIP